ncbi:hypothetical protein BDQ17DRAFT_573192 [Cyathus striatus]|nr:hypothetical protein BDQ17DRAFT_573192 [Cyathus striatus]
MRFSVFATLAISAATMISAAPTEGVAELSGRQLSCDFVGCATSLVANIPALLLLAPLEVLSLTTCATTLLSSPTTAVPGCLALAVGITGVLPTNCITSCL